MKPQQLWTDVLGTHGCCRTQWVRLNLGSILAGPYHVLSACFSCAGFVLRGLASASASKHKARSNHVIICVWQASQNVLHHHSPAFLQQLTQTVNTSTSRGDCDFRLPPHLGQPGNLPKGGRAMHIPQATGCPPGVQYLTHQNLLSTSYHKHRLDFHWKKKNKSDTVWIGLCFTCIFTILQFMFIQRFFLPLNSVFWKKYFI